MKVMPVLGVLAASAAVTALTAACVSQLSTIVNAPVPVPQLKEHPEAGASEQPD